MKYSKSFSKYSLFNYLFFSWIFIFNTLNSQVMSANKTNKIDFPKVISYRSASCSCCKKWINHLVENGLKVVYNIVDDIPKIKNKYQIPNDLRSCHSAQIGNYILEGHVTIESIKKLYKERPLISSLAVPGMPHGSPGMEIHSHKSNSHNYESYKVFSFGKYEKKYLITLHLYRNNKLT